MQQQKEFKLGILLYQTKPKSLKKSHKRKFKFTLKISQETSLEKSLTKNLKGRGASGDPAKKEKDGK